MRDDFDRGWDDRRKGMNGYGGSSHTRNSNRFSPPMAALSDPPGFFVLHAHHAQPLRRNGWTGFGAVAQLVEAEDVVWGEFAAADFEERPDHLANHVAQKRPAAHGIDKFFAVFAANEFARVNFPHRRTLLVVVLGARGRGERREIMRANVTRGGNPHGLFVERKRVVQNVAPDRRWNHFPPVKAVTIDFCPRRPPRIEIRPHLSRPGDSNCLWKQRVQRTLEFTRRQRRLRSKAGHLTEGMHARVRAPRPMQLDVLLRKSTQHSDYLALNCGFVRLNLPPVELRAVVGDGQLEVAHAVRKDSRPTARSAQIGCRASVRRRRPGKAGNPPARSSRWEAERATGLRLRTRCFPRFGQSARRQRQRAHRPLRRRELPPASSLPSSKRPRLRGHAGHASRKILAEGSSCR